MEKYKAKAYKAALVIRFLYDNYYSDYLSFSLWLTKKVSEKMKSVDTESSIINYYLTKYPENNKNVIKANKVLHKDIKKLKIITDILKSLSKDLEVFDKDNELLNIDNLLNYETLLKAYKAEIDVDYLFEYVRLKIPTFFDDLKEKL